MPNKEVKVGDTKFVVRELTVQDILDFFESSKIANAPSNSDAAEKGVDLFKDEIQSLVDIGLKGDHKIEDFTSMRPSDIKQIWDAFKEANEVFFEIARQLGMEKILDELKNSITKTFSDLLVYSSALDMASPSLNLGTPTS